MPEVIPLFAKPLYRTKIDVSGINLSKIEWVNNSLNSFSKDVDILSRPDFANIMNQLKVVLREYFYDTMGVDKKTKLYFTESWLTKTEAGQRHHRHTHPNSIVSGIVCLDTDGDSGKTRFVDGTYNALEFDISIKNMYNAKDLGITPEIGNVLLFPSSVEHMVDVYEGNKPRIMLAFNTFVKGPVNSVPLVKLKI